MSDNWEGELRHTIQIFLAKSKDDGTPNDSSDSSVNVMFIKCLFKIWSIFHSLLNVEQGAFEVPSTRFTPDKKMEKFYLKACENNKVLNTPDQLNKLKNIKHLLYNHL